MGEENFRRRKSRKKFGLAGTHSGEINHRRAKKAALFFKGGKKDKNAEGTGGDRSVGAKAVRP